MYAHYADIKKIKNNIVTIKDRNNDSGDDSNIAIKIEEDEKEYIKKCKWVRLEFLKKPPEDDINYNKCKGKITINVDMSDMKLPDYQWTIGDLMEEGKTYKEVCLELGLDPKTINPDDGEIVKAVPVPKKDVKRFKKLLMNQIREDIQLIVQMYEDGEIEQPCLDDAIDDCAGGLYTEMEELSMEIAKDISIKVK